jgi:hypothetical protein
MFASNRTPGFDLIGLPAGPCCPRIGGFLLRGFIRLTCSGCFTRCYNAPMEAEPPKADLPKIERRWFQFRLRMLLIPLAFALVSIVYFFVLPALRERQAKEKAMESLKTLDDALKRYEASHPTSGKEIGTPKP